MVVLELITGNFIKLNKEKLLNDIQELQKSEYSITFKEDLNSLCEDFARLKLLGMEKTIVLSKYRNFKTIDFAQFISNFIVAIESNGSSDAKAIIPYVKDIEKEFLKMVDKD